MKELLVLIRQEDSWPQSQCGRCGGEENLLPLPGIESMFLADQENPLIHSLSLRHNVQPTSVVHQFPNQEGSGDSWEGKAAGEWN
jgi:GGDEF domain-containing protein